VPLGGLLPDRLVAALDSVNEPKFFDPGPCRPRGYTPWRATLTAGTAHINFIVVAVNALFGARGRRLRRWLIRAGCHCSSSGWIIGL